MVNPLLLAGLADHIASHFSHDASRWRPNDVRTAPGTPIAVEFRFAGGVPSYGPSLLEALGLRLAAPYTTRDWAAGSAIVAAGRDRPADAPVAFRAEARDGALGVAYELSFRDADAVLLGWFSVAGTSERNAAADG